MTTESAVREAPVARSLLTCRLCGSSELRSFLDIDATPPCELFLTAEATVGPEARTMAYRLRGFWQPADTIGERTVLDAAYQGGTRPRMLWERPDRDPIQAAIDDAHRER